MSYVNSADEIKNPLASSKIKNYFNLKYIVPLVLLIAGLYLMPIKIFETDFSKIPGDFGDARFNNYILEHGHKFIIGKVDKYWDAPFMYPYQNTIAFSDNLLGTLPIYSAFRLLGQDRETAFQLWLLTLFALNFICCFWVLNKWSGNSILAATGAYIFAFSIFNLGHIYNAQNFPRFIVPFLFYWAWKYLSQKEIKYFFLLFIGIVFQFYCGIYLGFFSVYSLLFLFIAYIVVYRDSSLFTQFKAVKKTIQHLLILVLAAALLVPLMNPYIEISKKFGMRNFADVVASIPTLRSYFFTTKASIIWQGLLAEHGIDNLPVWWCHFLFTGILPWIGIVLVPFILFRKKTTSNEKQFMRFICLGFFLNFIFCLNINGFTLYKFIFELPGFSSMRSINRVINTEIMYFILIFVFVFNELNKRNKIMRYLVFSLPLLIILDNLINPQEVKRYNKKESQQMVKELKNKIATQYDKKYTAIAYTPDKVAKDPTKANLTTMLASQELNIPCVNAYSGSYPDQYLDFFNTSSKSALTKWLNYNNCNDNTVQQINDFNIAAADKIQVQIKAANNKFISAGGDKEKIILANRDNADGWEIFTLLKIQNNEVVLYSYKNLILSPELNKKAELTDTRTKIGAWETFTIQYLDNDFVAFKAANNKYLSLDEKSQQIYATGDSIGKNEKFKLITKN